MFNPYKKKEEKSLFEGLDFEDDETQSLTKSQEETEVKEESPLLKDQ
jgi:hypothetical protein